MKRISALSISMILTLSMFAGCGNDSAGNLPQISKMSLSASQQEIIDLISHMNNQILLFDYNLGDALNEMEIWVEIRHYGKYLADTAGLHIFGDQDVPLKDGKLVVEINRYENGEFRWTISAEGARSISGPWFAENEGMAGSYGSITAPVPISGGQEIILYLSILTTGNIIHASSDLQRYLEHPEEFDDYTYVHIVKARFS